MASALFQHCRLIKDKVSAHSSCARPYVCCAQAQLPAASFSASRAITDASDSGQSLVLSYRMFHQNMSRPCPSMQPCLAGLSHMTNRSAQAPNAMRRKSTCSVTVHFRLRTEPVGLLIAISQKQNFVSTELGVRVAFYNCISAAAKQLILGPTLMISGSVALWCATICCADACDLSCVVWASAAMITS